MKHALITLVFGGLASTATAETLCWDATMGLLPHEAAVPFSQRYTMSGTASFLTLGPTTLRINDSVAAQSISLLKSNVPTITSTQDWEYEVVLQMHSAARSGLVFGCQTDVIDNQKMYALAIDTTGVGFLQLNAAGWVDSMFHSMDATNALHSYRVVKTATLVELFIDGAGTPALSIPRTSFPNFSTTQRVLLAATSVAGTADFEIASFTFRRDTGKLDLAACPPAVSAGDTLTLDSRNAAPNSVNLLYVIDVSGVPVFSKVLLSNADALGNWSLAAPVPAGLAGLEVTLLQFGFQQASGKFDASNAASVALR